MAGRVRIDSLNSERKSSMGSLPRTKSGKRVLSLYCERPNRCSRNLENANRKSRPLHAWLSQAKEIETGRDAAEIDLSSQDHHVILEPSRSSRAQKLVTISVQ